MTQVELWLVVNQQMERFIFKIIHLSHFHLNDRSSQQAKAKIVDEDLTPLLNEWYLLQTRLSLNWGLYHKRNNMLFGVT